jgi:hypothetical protein
VKPGGKQNNLPAGNMGLYMKQKQVASRIICWFLAELILSTLKMEQYVPPKRRLTLNGLHGVISQKIVLFTTTTVRTSNPTNFFYSILFQMWHQIKSSEITDICYYPVSL